jgi:hypothetical protein
MRIAALLAAAALVACGSDNKQIPADGARPGDATLASDGGSGGDAPLTDAGVDASCFATPDPSSNYQIINACTTAQKVFTTHPKPPLLNADGSLPPLPP